MNRYVSTPFLPNSKVSTLLVDGRIPKSIENKIRAEGINIIKTFKCSDVDEAISYHPDIVICHIGKSEVVVAPNIYGEMRYSLEKLGLKVIMGNTFLRSTYPHDVAYNIGRVGRYAIHNYEYTDPIVIERLKAQNIVQIHVEQGYSKCSIAIVNDEAIITSDKGIERRVKEFGIDVLLIESGSISLPGMNYGFIGGAAGLIDKQKMFFCGNIKKHPDYKKIQSFLNTHNVAIEYDRNHTLIDLGSIIPIIESC